MLRFWSHADKKKQQLSRSNTGQCLTWGCSRRLPKTATAGPVLRRPLHSGGGYTEASEAAPQWSVADPQGSEIPPGEKTHNTLCCAVVL